MTNYTIPRRFRRGDIIELEGTGDCPEGECETHRYEVIHEDRPCQLLVLKELNALPGPGETSRLVTPLQEGE